MVQLQSSPETCRPWRLTGPHFSRAFYCGGSSRHVCCVALRRAPRRTVEYVCGALSRAPCIHARLRRLATKPREKCGLGACPRIGKGRVPGLEGADARRRDAGDVGAHRRGAPTKQMPLPSRNPKGAWGLHGDRCVARRRRCASTSPPPRALRSPCKPHARDPFEFSDRLLGIKFFPAGLEWSRPGRSACDVRNLHADDSVNFAKYVLLSG